MKKFIDMFNLFFSYGRMCKDDFNNKVFKSIDIAVVNVSFEGKKIFHSDKLWINDVVSKMGDAKPTRKESVQDVPKVDNYIKVDFKVKKENFTVFAYEEKGKYYIERPYQGIYEIDDNLYQKLQQK